MQGKVKSHKKQIGEAALAKSWLRASSAPLVPAPLESEKQKNDVAKRNRKTEKQKEKKNRKTGKQRCTNDVELHCSGKLIVEVVYH